MAGYTVVIGGIEARKTARERQSLNRILHLLYLKGTWFKHTDGIGTGCGVLLVAGKDAVG